MKKLLGQVRRARHNLVEGERYDVAIARDIFLSRATARILSRRGILPNSAERSIGECRDCMALVLGDAPQYVRRAALHERELSSIDPSLGEALDHDPLMVGWAYQFWNETERDAATTAIPRRGEPHTEMSDIAVSTQLFTEEYMASFLVRRCLSSEARHPHDSGGQRRDMMDPACGAGHILVPFFRALCPGGNSGGLPFQAIRDVLSVVHGCDIDETAVELCRVILIAAAYTPHDFDTKAAWSIVRSNIRHLPSPWGTLDRRETGGLLGRTFRYVVTNPPYIGRRKLHVEARAFLDTHYPATSMDLCAAFMERSLELTADGGMIGLVTVDKWLRLKAYDALRLGGKGFSGLYRTVSLDAICELGPRAFGAASGLHDGVGVCLLTASKVPPTSEHTFLFVSTANRLAREEKIRGLQELSEGECATIRQSTIVDRGQSSAFILHHGIPRGLIASRRTVRDIAQVVVGLQTSDDRRFVRYVWSVPPDRDRWIVHSKGGGYGRWSGLHRYVLDWGEGRCRFEVDPKSGIRAKRWFDEEGWTYTWFANGSLGLRHKEAGWSFGRAASSGVFCEDKRCIAFLNSRMASLLARRLGGKAQLPEGIVRALPIPESFDGIDPRLVDAAVLLKKALVEHDPTDASFSPWHTWEPRQQAGMEALLLVIEGILERQVCESLHLSHDERRRLDDTMGVPVAWYGRQGLASDDEVWGVLPSSMRFLRSLVEPRMAGDDRQREVFGDCASYFDSPVKNTEQGRPLPSTSLVESICRATGLHPFDVAIDLMSLSGENSAFAARVIAPALCTRVVALALTVLGHRWWGEARSPYPMEFPELPLRELSQKVAPALSEVVQIPERSRVEIIGSSLERWMALHLRSTQLRVFARTPLLEWRAGRTDQLGVVRHLWSAPEKKKYNRD